MNKLCDEVTTVSFEKYIILILSSLFFLLFSIGVNATESNTCTGTPGTPVCDIDTDKYVADILGNTSCGLLLDVKYPDTGNTNISVTWVDLKTINWTSKVKVCEVLVSGGGYFIPYKYDTSSCACSGSGLVAQIDPYNNCTFDISNVKFVYSNEPCNGEKCYGGGETAWAAGSQYGGTSNWATYVTYSGAVMTVNLLAGQHNIAGTVKLEPSGTKVKITITLADGWSFADVSDNVKIQGYTSTPVWNSPKLGKFAVKKSLDTSVRDYVLEVDKFKFYGIHLDLVPEVPCVTPTPEPTPTPPPTL